MTTERDDFDDAATATLLRTWGDDVREGAGGAGGAKLFEPPRDLGAIVRRDRFRLSRVHAVLAIAAALALAVGAWLIAQRLGWTGSAPSQRSDFALGEIALTSTPTLLRGDPRPTFHSGDTLYVHLHADRAGTAFVALLDARLDLVPVAAGTVLALDKGANLLGPFTLDDVVGTESIVILATEESLDPGTFEEILKRAATTVERGPTEHGERLRDILIVLSGQRDLAVQAATFEHRSPRGPKGR